MTYIHILERRLLCWFVMWVLLGFVLSFKFCSYELCGDGDAGFIRGVCLCPSICLPMPLPHGEQNIPLPVFSN